MRPFRIERSDAFLDIVSYGRRGRQEGTARLTPAQVEQIRRTVTRASEVMIKVTSGAGSGSSAGVAAHFKYISRNGELAIETDDGDRLNDRAARTRLLDDWDLDLDQDRKRPDLFATNRRQAPKLVHKLIFSMPAGTPPDKVLSAVRDFVREEFGFKHRYAMVLHTDEPHPHVHVVVKAVSEDGVRLNIRKTTLREWRQEFARHLRQHGIEANATARAIRGKANRSRKDGMYRAALRGESTYMRDLAEEAKKYLAGKQLPVEPAKTTLIKERRHIELGWHAVSRILERQDERSLAEGVVRFVNAMRPPQTDLELTIEQLLERQKARGRTIGLSR